MTTKKTTVKKAVTTEAIVKKSPKGKTIGASKQKAPKFKLISYTMKATIPTGQYANIQPEVTVQADSIEAAERAVMPYFETLFAKYRDGGVKPIVPVTPAPTAPVTPKPVAPVLPKVENNKVTVPVTPSTSAPVAPVPQTIAQPVAPIAPAIVMTVPFERAKAAINSCLVHSNLELVSKQIENSTKLIDSEKIQLKELVTVKYNDITIANTKIS